MAVLKDALEAGADLLGSIKPPKKGDDIASRQHIWNWRIFLALVAVGGGFGFHLVLACGYLPSLFPGFANAGDVQQIASAQRQANLIALQDALLTTNERWCKSSGEARGLYWRNLTELRSQYFDLAKRELPLPSCTEI